MPTPLTIVMPIFDGVTQLDFTGPYQFFFRTPDVTVIVASMDGRTITANGLTYAELADLRAIERCDVLCVPGGNCVPAMEDNERHHRRGRYRRDRFRAHRDRGASR
jgi:cyclohexyl-isocyanide hydratase